MSTKSVLSPKPTHIHTTHQGPSSIRMVNNGTNSVKVNRLVTSVYFLHVSKSVSCCLPGVVF